MNQTRPSCWCWMMPEGSLISCHLYVIKDKIAVWTSIWKLAEANRMKNEKGRIMTDMRISECEKEKTSLNFNLFGELLCQLEKSIKNYNFP